LKPRPRLLAPTHGSNRLRQQHSLEAKQFPLIAVMFGTLFIFVGLLLPDAFKGITFAYDHSLASSVFYLSFVTLTSTGYGDFVPVHPIARSLCNLESLLGQLFPATLLARLVTLELRDHPS
jgi:ion channel